MVPIVTVKAWNGIADRRASLDAALEQSVRTIIEEVACHGDEALLAYTERFDGVRPDPVKVGQEVLRAALKESNPAWKKALGEAAANIRRFHRRQLQKSWFVEDGDGVRLGQRVLPIERVALYVPGGTAAYPSSVLMTAIPAQVAGVGEIYLVSPPQADGLPHPPVMATAALLGLKHVYAVGGAQTIAALAYGTASIPRVDKIVGPGNAYVAAAKKMVYGQVDIDSIAGPSEIVVLADETADPLFVAYDLLAQAEHDTQARAILVTTHHALAVAVQAHVTRITPTLKRSAIVEQSLQNHGVCIVADTMEEAIAMVNRLAPEHLELLVRDPWNTLPHIRHAGAVFLGPYSSEPVGDYYAGPNHVLPTGGTARFASALGVEDFVRKQSVIAYSREKLRKTGSSIAILAYSEGLEAHARAVEVRLQ